MEKLVLACLLILAIAASGCVTKDDAANLAKSTSTVQEFIAQNPDAAIKAVYLPSDEVSAAIDSIREKCGQQMQPKPYYYVTITQGKQAIEAYIDSDATKILCMIKPAVAPGQNTEITPTPADQNNGINPTPTDQNAEKTPESKPSGLSAEEEALQLAEKKLQDTVCGILPSNAMHAGSPQVQTVMLQIPSGLDSAVSALGDTLAFTRQDYESYLTDKGTPLNTVQNYTGEKYMANCFRDDGQVHYCVIPIAAEIMDELGNKTALNGGIKLVFEGELAPLQQQTDDPCGPQPHGDCPVPKCYPWCDVSPVQTYTRTSCEIGFENPCPQIEGKTLCSQQCKYNDYWNDGVRVSDMVANAGKCMYCDAGTTCDWEIGGICGGFKCKAAGTSSPNGGIQNANNYLVACSGCQEWQSSYYYNGPSWAICNYYYNLCIQDNCTDKKTNCG